VAVTERVTVRLPDGFNPDRHATALARLIADRHGEGFEIVSIDPAGGTAYATRHVAITEVSAADTAREHFDVRLARGTKLADGDRLAAMDAWNQGTHGRSGLIDKVKASTHTEAEVEAAALAFLDQHVPAKASPMCGNSICQDRRFLARWMPALEDWFHYRNLDVSTLKELCKRWQPEIARGFAKDTKHTALADVYESIDELQYYRTHFIRG